MAKGFDEKCYDLAEHFLHQGEVHEPVIAALAQRIQDTVEDFIAEHVRAPKEARP